MNERFNSDHDAMEYALDPEEPLTVAELSELASIVESEPYTKPMGLEEWEEREALEIMGEQEREAYNQIWTGYARKEARRAA